MSSVPPPPTPPENPLPWEARQTRGALEAFFDTLGLFFSRPVEAWARTRERGDLASPLLFGTIIAWGSYIVHRVIFHFVALPMVLPGALGRRFGTMGNSGFGHMGFLASVIVAPFVMVIALFIGTAVLHVCCMLTGALTNSTSGFEGSFRAVAYSEVSSLATMIPVVGHLIALVWWIVLAVLGIQRLHKTTQGKAIAAVLIPVVVCCGGILLIGLVVGTAFLMHRGH